MSQQKIDYVTELRETLQDYPELNHILLERNNGEEYTKNELERYLKRAIARINMKPPVTRYSFKNFPQTHWILVVDGAIIEALKSKGLLKVRNDMPYQDQGGTSVQLDGKGQQYLQISMNLFQTWMSELMDFKQTISVRNGWGGVHSEYTRNWW